MNGHGEFRKFTTPRAEMRISRGSTARRVLRILKIYEVIVPRRTNTRWDYYTVALSASRDCDEGAKNASG